MRRSGRSTHALDSAQAGHREAHPGEGRQSRCAVGGGGHVVISTNAVDWQQLDTGQTNQLLYTVFAGGKFVVSGANGTLLTSVDGVNWMRQALDTTNTLGEVAWSGGTFAVREVGTAAVFTSSDSILWSRQLMPTNVALTDTLMGWEEGFLALVRTNQYSPAQLLRSTDGRAWSPETSGAMAAAHFTRVLQGKRTGRRSSCLG